MNYPEKFVWSSCCIIFFFIFGLAGYYIDENSHLKFSKKLIGKVVKFGECKKSQASFDQSGKKKEFRINILYSYEFNKINYKSSRVFRSNSYGRWAQEKECIANLKKLTNNSFVNIWIDPTVPEFSVLDPFEASHEVVYSGLVFGFVSLIISLYLNRKNKV
jgi:hypothetical protein